MRKFLPITLIFLSLVSCHDSKFDELDFIAYSCREVDSDDPIYAKEWRVNCPYYLHVDNKYNVVFISEPSYPDSSTKFFEIKNDPEIKEIIDEIIIQSKDLNAETDFRPPIRQLRLYDGSDLKIRIIKGKTSKIIHFWQDQQACQSFEKLLTYSKILHREGNHSSMIPKAIERRQDFIKFVFKSDSILRPLPPLPPRDVKPEYSPPKVIE